MSRLATHTSNSTHRYRSKIIEKILKWIYKYVHSGTVHSSQRTEITKIPLRGEWINKMKYVHSTEYYSVVNTNEILTHTNCRWTSKPMWKKPDTKRSHIVWFNVYKVARTGKSIQTESRLVVVRRVSEVWVGRGNEEWPLNGYQVFFCSDKNGLELDRSDGCTILNTTELYILKCLI